MPDRRPDSRPLTDDNLTDGDPDSFGGLSFAGLTDFMGPSAQAGDAADDVVPGTVVGDVRILRLLGAGGMGRVYEGIQASTQRPVAVKVIRAGIVSAAAARRLAHEAQILARLSHPGIARIYSAGVARVAGREMPYFVMEYVDRPRSITRFATEQRLSQRQRVELFREVCRAVAHGHERGVVHRDLKPGNILVDAGGQPKVIDFGVARCTADDGQLTTMHTGTGELLGTAQYMAPEQLYGMSSEIDARADVYALGLILYEVLTGALPYDVRERPIYEVARVVREVEPKSLAAIDHQLRGDLTAIVATCLDKERGRRYPSAAALAADLDRHLAGEPIVARPPGFIESLVRLAGRHRVAAFGVAGVLAALVAGAVGMSIFALRVEQQRAIAASSATLATQQLYRANVRSLQSFLEARNIRAARATFEENRALVGDPLPLEMLCLAPGLDDAIAVVEPTGDSVVGLAFRDGGSLLDVSTVKSYEGNPIDSDSEAIANRPAHLRLGQRQMVSSYRVAADRLEAVSETVGAVGARVEAFARPGEEVDALEDGRRLLLGEDGRVILERPGLEAIALGDVRGRFKKVAFAPGGARVALLGEGGRLDLWDGVTGAFVARCDAERPIEHLVFSPDGSRLAVADFQRGSTFEVRVIDLASGFVVMTNSVRMELSDFDLILAFGADADRLLMSGGQSSLEIWNVAAGSRERTLAGHTVGITAAVWSAEGHQIASADRSGKICLWDATSGDLQHSLFGHVGPVLSLVFTPDGRRLVSGGSDGAVRLWSPSLTGPLNTLPLQGEPTALAFRPTGGELAVATVGGDVELWNAATAEMRRALPVVGGEVSFLSYSADGRLLAAAGHSAFEAGEVRIWEADSGPESARLEGFSGNVIGAVFSPDGSRLVTTSADGVVAVWSLLGPERLWSATADVDKSLAKPWAVFGLGGDVVAYKQPVLFDAATGAERQRLIRGQIWSLAVSPDGRRLFRGTAMGRSRLVDLATGETIGFFIGHTSHVPVASFSADGRRLVTGSTDGMAMIWDVESQERLHVLNGHEGAVAMACFTPDQRRVVTASSDGTARIWDANLGAQLCQFPIDPACPQAVAVSPDGRLLVTAGSDASGPHLRLYGLTNAAITAARFRSPPARSH